MVGMGADVIIAIAKDRCSMPNGIARVKEMTIPAE